MRFIPLFILTLILFASCDTRKIDMGKYSEEKKRHEIQKLDDGDIMAKAVAIGEEVLSVDSFSKSYLDSINQNNDFEINIMSSSNVDSSGFLQKEKEIFNAVEYGVKEGQNVSGNAQFVSNKTRILYSKPLMKNDTLLGVVHLRIKSRRVILSMQEE